MGIFLNAPAIKPMACMFRIAGQSLTSVQFCELQCQWPKRGEMCLRSASDYREVILMSSLNSSRIMWFSLYLALYNLMVNKYLLFNSYFLNRILRNRYNNRYNCLLKHFIGY